MPPCELLFCKVALFLRFLQAASSHQNNPNYAFPSPVFYLSHITHPRPTPHRPGAFSCPHSPGPRSIISCASVTFLRPLYGVIGEMSTPRMLERTDIFLGGSEGCGRYGGSGRIWIRHFHIYPC